MQYAVWLYHRFNLSHRDVEYLMAERGVTLSYKAFAFGATSSGRNMLRLRRKQQGYGGTFFIDKVFVKIQGKLHYLWRAVDQYKKSFLNAANIDKLLYLAIR